MQGHERATLLARTGLNTLHTKAALRSSHLRMYHWSLCYSPKRKPTCSQLINTELCILKIIPFSLEFQVNPGILVLWGTHRSWLSLNNTEIT